MDIISRLKYFLQLNDITSSQFADTCDIPRPTVSQLLNGRNKKVSDEVIAKIHSSYPNLSIMWLMFGEEPIAIDNKVLDSKPSEILKSQTNSNLFSNNLDSDERKIVFSGNEFSRDDNHGGTNSTGNTISEVMANIARQVGAVDPVNNKMSGTSATRKIVNVMVFYSDNSFQSFSPDA